MISSLSVFFRNHRGRLLICLLLALAGWLLSLKIPPMQSPDENQHVARAYLLAHGDLTLSTLPSRNSGGWVDGGLVSFINGYMTLPGNPARHLSASERAQLDNTPWQGERSRVYFEIPGTGYYLPLAYLPHAVGLRAGEWAGLSVDRSYRLARMAVLLACLGLLAWSFSLLRPPSLVLAVLLLPMSVFQLLSPSLDGLTTSLALLAISIFLSVLRGGQVTPRWASWTLATSLLIVVGSRVHLLPMLLMPFFLFWKHRHRRDLYLGIGLVLASLGWVAYALLSTTDLRVVRSHGTVEVLRHYLKSPQDYVRVVWRTLLNADLRDFYFRSFVGNLGWLDAPLRPFFYPWLGVGLCLCALASLSWRKGVEDVQARTVLLAIAIASASLVFLALLVTWTPHPASVILGVQGRYFVVPVLLTAYALGGFGRTRGLWRQCMDWLLLAAFAGLSLTALILGLQDRFAG